MNKSNKKELLVDLFILTLILLVFYHWIIFFNPYILFVSDVQLDFPMHCFISEHLQKGEIPLWDPYYYGPLVAYYNSAIFYPPNFIMDLLFREGDLDYNFVIYTAQVLLHILLAGFFMYLLMRRLGTGRFAAIWSSVIFCYSGFFVAEVIHLQLLNSGIWLPLILLLLLEALESSFYYSLIAGVVLGMAILAGHPQPAIYYCAFITVFCLYHGYSHLGGKSDYHILARSAGALLVCFTVAIGCAAVQILPVLEYIPFGLRAATNYDDMMALGSVPSSHIITLLAPDFFGGCKIPYWASRMTHINVWETNYYIGIIPLVIILMTITHSIKRRYLAFFIITFLVSLFLMMGKNTVLSAWLYQVPGFDKVRLACRLRFMVDFSLAVATGLAVQTLVSQSWKDSKGISKRTLLWFGVITLFWSIIFIIYTFICLEDDKGRFFNSYESILRSCVFGFISAVCIYFYTLKKEAMRRYILGALFLFALIDLFSYQMYFVARSAWPEDPTSAFRRIKAFPPNKVFHPGLLGILQRDKGIFRVRASELFDHGRYSLVNKMFTPGYGGSVAIARLSEFRRLYENPEPDYQFTHPESKLVEFYNIKYLHSSSKNLTEVDPKYQLIKDAPGPDWYINTRAFPRAFIVPKVLVIKDESKILATLEEIDTKEHVILEEDIPVETSQGVNTCKIVSYRPTEVDIEVDMQSPGILVLSDLWYPGWKAFVGGTETKIYRANYAFRAVALPEGSHKVRFVYSPASVKLGACISLGTLFVVLSVGVMAFLSKRLLSNRENH